MSTGSAIGDQRAREGEVLHQSLERVMQSLQLAPSEPPPASDSVLARVWNGLTDIQSRAQQGVPDTSEVLGSVYRHMVEVLDLAATMISSEVKADTTVTIKLLWLKNNGDGVVRTFLRNRRSREWRDGYDPPNDYAYDDNTAFESILSGRTDRFASDNLLVEEAAGRYRNTNSCWPDYYNTTYVVPIPPNTIVGSCAIGFLCADSYFGPMNSEKVGGSLESMSQHLYNMFGLCSNVVQLENSGSNRGGVSNKSRSFHPSGIGWRLEGSRLIPKDSEQQLEFQAAIELIQLASENNDSVNARATAPFGVQHRRIFGRPGPSRGHIMQDDAPSWAEFLTDEDRDPADKAAIDYAKSMTTEQHLAFMKEIAPHNRYAHAFVERARRSR